MMEDREVLLTDEGEKHWQLAGFRRPSKDRTVLSTLKEYFWLITMGLLVAIVGLQLVIWRQMSARSECARQVGGDYLKKAPTFATEVVQWKADYDYVPLNASQFLDQKIQRKWEENLIPAGAGFLPGGILTYNSTSVTHQLHCVYIMGKIFSAVVTKSKDIPEPEDYEAHFLHCVDYMRQAAMCGGDITIEPRGENGKPAEVTLENAFNGHHVCKDYSQVKNYLTEQVRDGQRNILPLDD